MFRSNLTDVPGQAAVFTAAQTVLPDDAGISSDPLHIL